MTTKCDFCGKEVYLPFVCKYCGGKFCVEHRLPENHNCPSLKKARPPPEKHELLEIEAKSRSRLDSALESVSSLFTAFEKCNLSQAILVLLTLILMEFINLRASVMREIILAILFPTLIVFVYILIPEFFSRKIRAGLHFEVSTLGLIFSIITSMLPIKVIYFGNFVESSLPFLSTAWVLYFVQILSLEVLYFTLAYFRRFSLVAEYFSIISLYLAIFTLIPLGNTSGNKVLKWNKWTYATLILMLLLLFVTSNFIFNF